MTPDKTPKQTTVIVTSLAASAVLSGLVFVQETLAGAAAENFAEGDAMSLIQPEDTNSGYTLPPLSDHILLAQLDEDQVALPQDNSQSVFGDDDTAKQYNRGYYTEPAQIAKLVPVPTTLEETEAVTLSDDGTARQFDRGYYREPEMIVAVLILPEEGS